MPFNFWLHFLFTHKEKQRGSAMIEMAIVLPVFIFLFIAIVDFGMFFNRRNVAQSAAYNGAKECAGPVLTNGSMLNSTTSILALTLPPLIAWSDLDTSSLPQCTQLSTGGATYMRVTIQVTGSMFSPFTSALGLYPITAVGIAAE